MKRHFIVFIHPCIKHFFPFYVPVVWCLHLTMVLLIVLWFRLFFHIALPVGQLHFLKWQIFKIKAQSTFVFTAATEEPSLHLSCDRALWMWYTWQPHPQNEPQDFRINHNEVIFLPSSDALWRRQWYPQCVSWLLLLKSPTTGRSQVKDDMMGLSTCSNLFALTCGVWEPQLDAAGLHENFLL